MNLLESITYIHIDYDDAGRVAGCPVCGDHPTDIRTVRELLPIPEERWRIVNPRRMYLGPCGHEMERVTVNLYLGAVWWRPL